MFLLITALGVFTGMAYASLVGGRFSPTDWRRWAALTPAWMAWGVVLLTSDTGGLVPQAIQAFALGSLVETLLDTLRVHRRRRADAAR